MSQSKPAARMAVFAVMITVVAPCSPALADGMSSMSMSAAEAAPGTNREALNAEQPFLKGNDAAMSTMMANMAVKPTGDVDKDFVDMMVPHHQGAIDMAKLLLLYGKNEKLKYLAQEIIVTQQQEIAAMRLAVGEPLPPSQSSPTASGQ